MATKNKLLRSFRWGIELALLSFSFSAGVVYEAKTNALERTVERVRYSRFEPEKGFAKDPWNLDIEIRVNSNNRLESYLVNYKLGVRKRINEDYSAGTLRDFLTPNIELPDLRGLKDTLEERLNRVLPPKGNSISLSDKLNLYKQYVFAKIHRSYESLKSKFKEVVKDE